MSAAGLIIRPSGSQEWLLRLHEQTFVVFPQYRTGASFSVTTLTAAQAALRLVGNCINLRNLPNSGLSLAGAVARHAIAVDLVYGDTAQLENSLNVLTRQVLAGRPSRDDFAAVCKALTAQASALAKPKVPEPIASPAPAALASPAVAREPVRLTVGMATYDDYDGVYFTIQAIRTYHPELCAVLEFIVIDNNPDGRCAEALSDLGKSIDRYRYLPRGDWRGTAVRNLIFEEASSDLVLCVDSHVLIVPGALARLVAYLDGAPDGRDLIQGPLVYDDLRHISTHFDPQWRGGMYGVWACDARGLDPQARPFEIPMQGLGVFACRRDAWPGFNPAFRGFGGGGGLYSRKDPAAWRANALPACPALAASFRAAVRPIISKPVGGPGAELSDRIYRIGPGYDRNGDSFCRAAGCRGVRPPVRANTQRTRPGIRSAWRLIVRRDPTPIRSLAPANVASTSFSLSCAMLLPWWPP